MKRILAMVLCLCMALSLVACGGPAMDETVSEEERYGNFMSEWTVYQDIYAVNAQVFTDAEGNRALMADVQNETYDDLSNLVLCFAAWDAQGNFVTIKSKNNPANTEAEFQMELGDVTVPGRTIWNADAGIYLDPGCEEIAYVKAAVVSCKQGDTDYTNELYEGWKEVYLQQTLTAEMRAVDAKYDPVEKVADLREQLKTEGMYITKAEPWEDDADGELFLTANVMNNSNQTVTGFTLAFVAWDANGAPVSMSTVTESSDGVDDYEFVKEASLSDASIAHGTEWIGCEKEDGSVIGISLEYASKDIDYVEAIVVSYTTEDGQTHENPHYSDWKWTFSAEMLESRLRGVSQ